MRRAGDFRAAEQLYWQGHSEAVRQHDGLAQVRFLMSVGGCQLGQYRYQDALSTYLQARELATAIGDRQDVGAIAGNLSTLYQQVWDIPAALRAANEGLSVIARPSARGGASSYYEAPLRLQLGRLHAALGEPDALEDYASSIEAARSQIGAQATETIAWDLLGEQFLATHSTESAERAFLEAHRLRALFRHGEVGFSYGRFGALELERGRLDQALRFTNRALAAARRKELAQPEHVLLHQRGRIRMAMGQSDSALQDFAQAVERTSRWRMEVPTAQSSLTGANTGLNDGIFRSFVEAAAARACRTHSKEWAGKAFQAMELNRTASLRESLALTETWRKNLPPEYWTILGQISAEEGRGSQERQGAAVRDRLYLRLTEMEAKAGRGLTPKTRENFRSQTSLNHFQSGIRDSELFLSFWLGAKSYVWAVSRDSLRIYQLPAMEEIAEAIRSFREALAEDRPQAIREGSRLYSALFGQLTASETRKPVWLLSLDGVLFDLPFAALVTGERNGKPMYLVENHSLQTVPGALLLTAEPRPAGPHGGRFLGIGDPIYNTADPRWRGAAAGNGDGQLERLVGSGAEVEASAGGWRGGAQWSSTLLRGSEANRLRFLRELEHPPSVVHLATHVLIPPHSREQGLIAFGLIAKERQQPQPEYVSASEVAALHVPGAMVVMTGCSTGTGTIRSGAGLLGLTRAWLMAGASTVIATAWPVEDTAGEFFARFYSHLRSQTPAEALRRSQIEEIHAGRGRSSPRLWASYQITGGIH